MLKRVLSENHEITLSKLKDFVTIKKTKKHKKIRGFDFNFLNSVHLNNYKENHEKEETIEMTNIHLLNSINTQTVDDNKDTCILFYDLEDKIHRKNENEVYLCIHKKLDPKVVENILDSKYPGCTAGCIKSLENLAGKRFIMKLQDRITKSKTMKEIIGLTIGILKVEGKYVDMFKDIALSILMLEAVGGYQAIIDFPTNFSSVIVMLMFGSVIIPLFLSTLHLVVNRKKIIRESNSSRMRKYITIILCWSLSFLNPIILDAYYQELKEDVRKMTENYNDDAMKVQKKCKSIKKEAVKFHKIELG